MKKIKNIKNQPENKSIQNNIIPKSVKNNNSTRNKNINQKKTDRKHKQRKAVILFCDIMNSSELSNILSFEEYDDFVYCFQGIMKNILEKKLFSLKDNPIFKDSKITIKPNDIKYDVCIRGDEVCMILYSDFEPNSKEENECENIIIRLALCIAIEMKRKWILSEINRKRIQIGKTILDVGIGINCGYIILSQHIRIILNKNIRIIESPEGYAINLAKRIESYSRSGDYSKIFISRSIYTTLKVVYQLAFSTVHMVAFKGISQSIPVYEVKSVGHLEGTAFAPQIDNPNDVDLLEEAIKYNPQDLWLILDLAHYYYDKEEYKKAAEKYKLSIEADPDFAPAHMYLGRSLYRNFQDKDALPHLERARELNPDSTRANNFLAVCLRRLGCRAKQKEYFIKALEYHRTAIRIIEENPDKYPWAFNAYALTLAQAIKYNVFPQNEKNDKYIEALKYIGLVTKNMQSGLFDHVNGYIIGLDSGKKKQTINIFESVIKKYTENKSISPKKYREKVSEIYYHLGEIYDDENKKITNYKSAIIQGIAGDIINKNLVNKSSENRKRRKDFVNNQYWFKDVIIYLKEKEAGFNENIFLEKEILQKYCKS